MTPHSATRALQILALAGLMFAIPTLTGCAADGEACTTTGADNFQDTCAGADLLMCVCDDWEGDDCPAREGTWVKQDILCTCSEWMAGNCAIE